ncbi:probable aldehyde dehydrogenase, partial [Tanacetum coccineum]
VAVFTPFNFPLVIHLLQLMGALYIRNKFVLKVDSKVCIVMEQMLRLLHDYEMPLDDVDFINFDGKTMNKLLLEDCKEYDENGDAILRPAETSKTIIEGENGDIYFQVKNDKDVLETLASKDNLVVLVCFIMCENVFVCLVVSMMHLVLECDAVGLKRKSSKKTVVEKNIEYVVEPIRAKKNNMCKKVVVKKNQVSVNEPTAAKKKNTWKKVDVEVHLVSVEPTSEKKKNKGPGVMYSVLSTYTTHLRVMASFLSTHTTRPSLGKFFSIYFGSWLYP